MWVLPKHLVILEYQKNSRLSEATWACLRGEAESERVRAEAVPWDGQPRARADKALGVAYGGWTSSHVGQGLWCTDEAGRPTGACRVRVR